MRDITTVGLDLAKTVFQVHGADSEGRPVLRRKMRRGQVLKFFAGLPTCLVGLEACASAHYWARESGALGHEVRLIPPQYVRPYVKTNKNDAADAEAICEAVVRPTMRFASAPMARICFETRSMATTEGSSMTMPRPRTITRVFAVPRSMPISWEKIPRKADRGLNTCSDHFRGEIMGEKCGNVPS